MLFFGFFRTSWIKTQTDYLNFRKLPNGKQQAFLGIRKISIAIIEFFRELWLLRNKHIHNPDPTGEISFQRQVLLQEIQQLYTNRNTLAQSDRNILPPRFLNTHNQKRNDLLQQFVRINKQIIQKSAEEIRNSVQYTPPEELPPPEPDPSI